MTDETGPVTMVEPARRPSERARTLWAVEAALGWVPVLIALVVWAVVDSGRSSWQIVVAVLVVVAAAAHVVVVPQWRFRVHRWEISETAVYSRSGWFTQEYRIAPISRIQTVDTERGPVERWLGLATVTVTTASSAGAVEIHALDLPVAAEITGRLTEIAGGNGIDAT